LKLSDARKPADPAYSAEYTFKSVPDYDGMSGVKPVLIADKYWAPVNEDATTAITSATSPDFASIRTEAYVGRYYQWGRYNAAFPYDGSPLYIIQGPVNYNDGIAYATSFIKTTAAFYNDWLSPQDATLWQPGTDKQRGPCPENWVVPTAADFNTLLGTAVTRSFAEGRLTITDNASGQKLYLPITGGRTGSTGNASNRDTRGYYWSSNPGTGAGATALLFDINNGGIPEITGVMARGNAFVVRCIQR
jgi:uncharacterized protein (TIGR02145 family)